MANTVSSSELKLNRYDYRHYGLRVSPYERVASMLLAVLVLVGMTVLALFIMWLTSQIFAGQASVPIVLEDIGTGEGQLGEGMQLEAPLMEQLGQESDLEEPQVENMLAAVADAVASRAALLEDPMLGEETRMGPGGSTGDGRMLGPGGGHGKGGGRARRWEVQFLKGNTLETYARQLDFFGIEMGVLMPGNKLTYVSNLAKAKPDVRTGTADKEKRYYLTWRQGELKQADVELLGRAGVAAEGKLILKFLPPEVESWLAEIEKARAGAEAKRVRATHFGIQTEGDGYTFFVIEQSYK